MTDKYPNAPACPFCGSTDLVDGDWYLEDEEVDAIECERCKAGAPASVWNARRDEPTDAELCAMWQRAGGDFHGPGVEHGTMPESKLYPFLRELMRGAPVPVPTGETHD